MEGSRAGGTACSGRACRARCNGAAWCVLHTTLQKKPSPPAACLQDLKTVASRLSARFCQPGIAEHRLQCQAAIPSEAPPRMPACNHSLRGNHSVPSPALGGQVDCGGLVLASVADDAGVGPGLQQAVDETAGGRPLHNPAQRLAARAVWLKLYGRRQRLAARAGRAAAAFAAGWCAHGGSGASHLSS